MSTALTSDESVADVVAGGETPAATGTLRFVLTKIGGGIISLLLVVVLGFFLFRVLPGDPIKTMTHGAPIGTRQLLALRAQLGLDKPLIVQFFELPRQPVCTATSARPTCTTSRSANSCWPRCGRRCCWSAPRR